MSERLCDGCGGSTGRVRVYQSKGTDYLELWLCDSCADALGVEEAQPAFAPTVAEILGSFLGGSPSRSCPVCGTRFRNIRQTGSVGCSECYRVFRSRIQRLLDQSGLTEPHIGRFPVRLGSYKRLLLDREVLRERLSDALADEDYERAATIRDRMRTLEEEPDADV